MTSIKTLIESAIEKGSTVATILKRVAKIRPDYEADESHVRFYANKLVREDKLDLEIAKKKYGCSGTRGRRPINNKPVIKKEAAKKPAVKKPAVKKPAVKKPAVKKPAVKKPAVKKPAVKKPAVKKPAVKKPAIKK